MIWYETKQNQLGDKKRIMSPTGLLIYQNIKQRAKITPSKNKQDPNKNKKIYLGLVSYALFLQRFLQKRKAAKG